VAKTLKEEQAQALADWQAKSRIEKIRQLEEERIRREMEQKREQEWDRGWGPILYSLNSLMYHLDVLDI